MSVEFLAIQHEKIVAFGVINFYEARSKPAYMVRLQYEDVKLQERNGQVRLSAIEGGGCKEE